MAKELLKKSTNDLVEQIAAIHKKLQQQPQSEKNECLVYTPVAQNGVQLPAWPEAVRAVPNGFLRSALFGAIKKGTRRYLQREPIVAIEGIEIFYTGQRLDQGDLDVWESVLHFTRFQNLGMHCHITSYALLKLMGRTDSGKNRAILQARLERLRANAIVIKQNRYSYIGGLITSAAKDEKTQEWIIELDPKLKVLFSHNQFTHVEWVIRHALDGHPLAQWLHGFYASHAQPFPIKIETLLQLAGSSNNSLKSGKQMLQKAFNILSKVNKNHHKPFEYTIRNNLVHVEKSNKKTS